MTAGAGDRDGEGGAYRRFALPRAMGGARRAMLVQLGLIGLGQSACVVAFAVLVHALLTHVRRGGARHGALAGGSAPALVIGLVVVSAATVALKAAGPPVAERLAQSYVHSVRVRLFDHVSGSQTWSTERRAIGVTVLRFTGDSSALRGWAGNGVASLAVNGVFVLCVLGVLAVFLPAAGLAALGALLLCGVVAALLGVRLRERVWAARRSNGRLASFVNERVTHAAVMQSLGRVDGERRVLRRRSRRFSREMVRQARFIGALGAAAEAGRIGVLVAVIGAAVLTGAGAATLTSLVTIAGFLAGPLAALAQAQEAWQHSTIARRRIRQVIDTPARLSTPRTGRPLTAGPGRLELAGVALDGVLAPVGVTVPAGARVAVQGPPGSGKSLLLAIIARLHVPDRGTILLDGQDLARHDPDSIGRAVRLVSPDLSLLRGSVAANLRHGEVPAGQLDERSRAVLAALAPVLTRLEENLAGLLPDGLATRVGEGGLGLSTAASYQVVLARALRSGPRLLLLDEADSASPDLLDELLRGYPGTLLYVTRDPDLVRRADLRWWIQDQRLGVAARAPVAPGPP